MQNRQRVIAEIRVGQPAPRPCAAGSGSQRTVQQLAGNLILFQKKRMSVAVKRKCERIVRVPLGSHPRCGGCGFDIAQPISRPSLANHHHALTLTEINPVLLR